MVKAVRQFSRGSSAAGVAIVLTLLLCGSARGADRGGLVRSQPQGLAGLSADVESLKKEVLDLNRDLILLEEQMLFPPSTQVTVFVSMDVGVFFELDAIELKIDNKTVVSHIYSDQERDALLRGGVHQLFRGNYGSGGHELVAVFTGKGPRGRVNRRATTYTFEKTVQPRFVELKITDVVKKLQPEFMVNEW